MPLHRKHNAKIADPNPNFMFISVLKDFEDSDQALELMRAVCVLPIPLLCPDIVIIACCPSQTSVQTVSFVLQLYVYFSGKDSFLTLWSAFEEAEHNPEYSGKDSRQFDLLINTESNSGKNWNGGTSNCNLANAVLMCCFRRSDRNRLARAQWVSQQSLLSYRKLKLSSNFVPFKWLLHVVCHELAHNKQMNHSQYFQAVNHEFKNYVRDLRERGYFGDGMWSDGTRVGDGALIQSASVLAAELPNYTCGGAATKKRKGFHRNRHVCKRLYQVVKPGSGGGEVTGRKGPKAGNRLHRALPVSLFIDALFYLTLHRARDK